MNTGEFAEAGVDAVDGVALGDDSGNGATAGFDRVIGGGIEGDGSAAIDVAPDGERNRARPQDNRHLFLRTRDAVHGFSTIRWGRESISSLGARHSSCASSLPSAKTRNSRTGS